MTNNRSHQKGLWKTTLHFHFLKVKSANKVIPPIELASTMDLASEFSSITGASELEAANWLEMAGYVLADAVQLYFGAEGQSGPPNAAHSNNNKHKHSIDNDLGAYDFEEEVRLPDQVKRQKLVDTDARIGNFLLLTFYHRAIYHPPSFCLLQRRS
jgi:hypothetical protein